MHVPHAVITGMFLAGVVSGTWWLALCAGLVSLALKRSYAVLIGGVLLDLWFASTGSALLFGGFFTLLFITVTIIAEFVRSRLFWSS